MLPIMKEIHLKNKRRQIETLLLLNRDLFFFHFYQKQTIIAAMWTVFALLNESNRVSCIQERKNNVLYNCFTRILTVNFYWKFLQRTFTQKTDSRTFLRHAFDLVCSFSERIFQYICDCLWSNQTFNANLLNNENKKLLLQQ